MRKTIRAFLAMGALATACASATGCVADRPSRNGVFNENQYLRKEFLVRPATNGPDGKPQADNGWFMKTTIIHTSTPNPLASQGFFVGAENNGAYVRWAITSDTLEMVNLREISQGFAAQDTREPEVLNSWPVTNVDLKYKINLDGEKSNFYEENQELPWQQRQFVKVNFGKNNMGDLASMGPQATFFLQKCTDIGNAFSTLVPNSFYTDEKNGYMQFAVSVTLPILFSDPACAEGSGPELANAQRFGRQNLNVTLMYSFTRAQPLPDPTAEGAYEPLEIAEKDPIRRKYGTIDLTTVARDQDTGLIGARQLALRFNPKKDIVYYYAPGYPEEYKHFFTDKGGIIDQTNTLLTDAGAKGRLVVKNFDEDLAKVDGAPGCDATQNDKNPNQCDEGFVCAASGEAKNSCVRPRAFGDVRYSFIRWESDIDTGSPFIGVTQFVPDPRTGELVSSSINIADFQLNDRVTARLDFFLQTIGATDQLDANGEWPAVPTGAQANCTDGDVMPFVTDVVKQNHNGRSTLYTKMQEYLQRPTAQFGFLGPQDFVFQQSDDFFKAYYRILPYEVFADPQTNQFVVAEGGQSAFGPGAQWEARQKEYAFHQMASQLDHGIAPYDTTNLRAATDFLTQFHGAQVDHREYQYKANFAHGNAMYDEPGMISLIQAFQRDARHCVNGKWETRKDYIKSLVDSYHSLTVWHEFGHAVGLDHNFMASVDRPNWPHYKDAKGDHIGMYQSSVMDYNVTADRVFWNAAPNGGYGWGPYDQGAISFIYANSTSSRKAPPADAKPTGISQQIDKDTPWHDPHGFTGNTEIQYLFCNASHIKFSPFCRQFDFGSTPSEIIAAQIDDYEWNYQWRNFRLYRKYWDVSAYADTPAAIVYDMKRFMAAWEYDWTAGEIQDTLRRIGVTPPPNTPAASYFNNLTNRFESDLSSANQMVGAFHKAIVQQGSGERPFKTVYDNFYGDTTQQGIFLDKLMAVQSFTDIWAVDLYDPNQSTGDYLASYSYRFGDPSYQTVAEDTVESMIGGQYDVFPFAKPLAVAQFAKATHDVAFFGRREVRDWVGGYVFYRQQDFLDFFKGLATKYNTVGCTDTEKLEDCTYDPSIPRDGSSDIHHSDDYNEFVGPDNRRWAWAYIQDRNTWVAVDRDRNTAAYIIVHAFNADVKHGEDDGNTNDAYGFQLPMKYFLDSFNQYN